MLSHQHILKIGVTLLVSPAFLPSASPGEALITFGAK